MKRIIALVLAAIFCSLTFCACSNENDSTKKDPIALSAREQLSKEEKKLYTYIMETIEEDFENPSAVRILDIGDLTEYGPKIIKVKFQGQTYALDIDAVKVIKSKVAGRVGYQLKVTHLCLPPKETVVIDDIMIHQDP